MSSWDRDLADFRASHRLTRRALAGLEWEYVACGRGPGTGPPARCTSRRSQSPALVERLVLSDTGVPRPGRARAMAALAPLIRRGPLPLLRGLLRAGVGLSMAQLPAQRSFWWRYFSARIAGISRAACLSHLAIWRDFDRGCVFSPADLAAWPGEMLIIEAEFDGLFRRPEQERLRDLYPRARVHTFANSPHGASLARMDDYIELIAGFLSL